MSIENAYSTELGKIISAIKANHLSREGKLNDNRAFLCTGSDDCKVQLTCVNFSKPPSEWGQTPHFKLSSEQSSHSLNCEYTKQKVTTKKQSRSNSSSVKKSGNFNLILGSNGFNRPKSDNPSVTGEDNNTNLTSYTKSSSSTRKTHQKNSNTKSFRKLIDIYQSLEYDNSTTTININSSSRTLENLFFNLDVTSEINYELHVYFGKAIIFERKPEDKYYIIKFITKHFYISENQRVTNEPSILVFKDQIENHKHLKRFKKYVDTNHIFTCYYFGYPKLHRFINFDLGKNYYNLFLKD
ncbi:hypothetical protein WKU33_13925 [Oceanobacillus sp. HCA-5259]|uniref:hypothetical protein n=1 Tax=Oceanobacillus sp. HCA-5259 TaxID=3134661 RepID=UPI0030BD28C4